MRRINITENGLNTPQWFDADSAETYKEKSTWNGSNWISNITGSQFHHEMLYKTKLGKWVLGKWSDYQGSVDSFEVITEETAMEWFIRNEGIEHIPAELEKNITKYEI